MMSLSGKNLGQHPRELEEFLAFVQKHKFRSYLEVGARHGDTFYSVASRMPLGSTVVAVDLPEGVWGRKGSRKNLENAVKVLRSLGYDSHVIFGDSTDPDVIAEVQSFGPYDLALIDGDHRYEGVKADWDNYANAARWVAFHDIAGEGCGRDGVSVEVPRLWRELKSEFSNFEIVAEGSRMGIGVVKR